MPHVIAVVTNITACVDGYVNAWNHVCNQSAADDNGILCPTTFALETANTAVSHDYVYNGTTNKPILNEPITWSIDKQALIQNSYKLGYDTGINDWNQHTDHRHYECPISHLAPDSKFCKGYDAALKYENSPYQAGYQRGQKDTTLSDIVAPGKRFASHTEEYIRGYEDGWCSLPGNGPYSGSDADEWTFECGFRNSTSTTTTP